MSCPYRTGVVNTLSNITRPTVPCCRVWTLAPARLSPCLSQLSPFTDRHRRIKGILGCEAAGIFFFFFFLSFLLLIFQEGLGHSCLCQCGPGLVAIPWRLKRKRGRKTSFQALCLGSLASDTVEYSSLANMFSGFVEKLFFFLKSQFLGDLWPLWQQVSTLRLGRGPDASFALLSKQVSRPAQSPVLRGMGQDATSTSTSQASKCSVHHKHVIVLTERPLWALALDGTEALRVIAPLLKQRLCREWQILLKTHQ